MGSNFTTMTNACSALLTCRFRVLTSVDRTGHVALARTRGGRVLRAPCLVPHVWAISYCTRSIFIERTLVSSLSRSSSPALTLFRPLQSARRERRHCHHAELRRHTPPSSSSARAEPHTMFFIACRSPGAFFSSSSDVGSSLLTLPCFGSRRRTWT